MASGKFATSIRCIDGRVQSALTDWIKKNYGVDFVDTITEPGADKRVATGINIDQLKNKANISIKAHKSNLITVSGHHDCAGNPVSKSEHYEFIKKSVEVIKSWNFAPTVIGLYVNENWEIEKVA